MKTIYKTLLVGACSIFFLSGCVMGPKYDKLEVTDTKFVYRTIPEELYTYALPEEPMKKEEFIKLSPPEKETYLTNYSANLLGLLKIYTVNFDQIRELQKVPEQKK